MEKTKSYDNLVSPLSHLTIRRCLKEYEYAAKYVIVTSNNLQSRGDSNCYFQNSTLRLSRYNN